MKQNNFLKALTDKLWSVFSKWIIIREITLNAGEKERENNEIDEESKQNKEETEGECEIRGWSWKRKIERKEIKWNKSKNKV